MRAIIDNAETYERLELAQRYAKVHSGCTKVSVGSVVFKKDIIVALGANKTMPNICRSEGCLRIEKYGENSKLHRDPSDCRAIHSEIEAIASSREILEGSTIYVTRYPCEACARAIVAAGIYKVVYGREQVISEETESILSYGRVEVVHFPQFEEDDVVER